jgi:hypothetical protein
MQEDMREYPGLILFIRSQAMENQISSSLFLLKREYQLLPLGDRN